MRAFVSVLARYPDSVVIAVTEPATGIPSKLKWPPSIAEVVKACDEAMEPILRDFDRKMVGYEHQRRLAPPAAGPKLSIDELEEKLGRPLPRLRRMDGSVRTKSIEEAEAVAASRRASPHDEPPEAA